MRAEVLQSFAPQRFTIDKDRLGAGSSAWRWHKNRGRLGRHRDEVDGVQGPIKKGK